MRISVPELLCSRCWSGWCVVLWPRGPSLSQLEELSVARPVTSDPSLPLSSCPVGRRKSPWFHGLLKDAVCGVLTSHPCSFSSAVCSGKQSLFQGENYQCESLPWATVAQLSCPALLVSMGSLHCAPVPQPSPGSGVPVLSCSHMRAPMNSSLLQQDSPGTLDHLASLVIIVWFWRAVQWSVQVHVLHRPFGSWWSVFSRIRVIQTSCTGRLKGCNPRLRARTAGSVCQWLLNHTPESLQALRLICTHSLAACQQVLHFQPWKYIQKIGFLSVTFLIYCSQQHMLS